MFADICPKITLFVDEALPVLATIILFPASIDIPPVESREDKLVALISQSATLPPVNKTSEPVICPLEDNTKFLLVSLILISLMSNPPISPPSNNTFEPVICPLLFKINSPFELDIELLSI